MVDLRLGDCLDVLRTLDDCSIDACVTDPPYGLRFMGKHWDCDVPSVEVWREVLRVLKPGAHLLAFFGTRTYHRGAVAVEDAGFDVRDMVAWMYGGGFPKSLDVSKAIAGRSEDAAAWQGWGTALKPAMEPVVVARKPLAGTVAQNVMDWGTGGINVDACRVGYASEEDKRKVADKTVTFLSACPMRKVYNGGLKPQRLSREEIFSGPAGLGRWPANVVHDGSAEVVAGFPDSVSTGGRTPGIGGRDGRVYGGYGAVLGASAGGFGDSGSAARFFYCAKADGADRDDGLDGMDLRAAGECVERAEGSAGMQSPRAGAGRLSGGRNHHPTVKPTDLMRWLVRLVTPKGGVVLDPYMGSGSTGRACAIEGFGFVGIEREAEYLEIARRRIAGVHGELFSAVTTVEG